jgi:hypothetical protein
MLTANRQGRDSPQEMSAMLLHQSATDSMTLAHEVLAISLYFA